MKITGEARLLLVMGLAVLLGGGAMVLVNKSPSILPSAPQPTPPPPLDWTSANFDPIVKQARHVRGTVANPRITIIEFGDLECPSCRRAYNSLLTKLDSGYPGIKFIFQNFPLNMHSQAMPAAIAAEAAANQGKFWPMFDALYAGEKTVLTPDYFEQCAAKVGLDLPKFKADDASPVIASKVQADEELATSLHISQTPTFVIRDEKTGKIYLATGAKMLDERLAAITGRPKLLSDDFK